ncbi:alpha/beta fold hydrolase [Puniceibacterium sp. IMCC21224]|uniref:alpha/beta fold hydrolase n=1 Tax=Puniceibacterium sp. IMCC21224 TaxID=1618204 RepID=UPI00064DA14C|nr:alpha/beta hydrolase [Puniceibacterium sp. IMCC21224]KMK69088.1 putative hydrolase or acyltransferase of alpha/beta superfamily [Puniceibacterium sp. IMCC21224]
MTEISDLGPSPFLNGFTLHDFVPAVGPRIRFAKAGTGEPLLLLHGHPQTHVTWRKIAPELARKYTVIAMDLRGYGDSDKPEGGRDHITYSKREMAKDPIALMRTLGFDSFHVVGHDRGGRVAHRMALDFPDAVRSVALFDIAPTATMYSLTDKNFATRYFWWFFLIQPYPLPEKMIGAEPEYFLRHHIGSQIRNEGATEEAAFREYLRCYLDPATRHAICEDYRAAATIDLEHDKQDDHNRIQAPVLVLWGAKGFVGQKYDVLQTWQEKAFSVSGRACDCGHTLQEEAPEAVLLELKNFFARQIH